MKRNKIKYDRWFRMLLLSFALLTGGGWMAWGQTKVERKSITLHYDENKHDSVFVDTKIIYVVPGQARELFIPELRISYSTNQDNNRYNWYVHWYVKGKANVQGEIDFKQFATTYSEAINQGGDLPADYTTNDHFVSDGEGGLVWSARLKSEKITSGYGIDASTIVYTAPTDYQDGDIVYCDVSIYQDGAFNSNIYTEPTLSKRTKYIIKNADEFINREDRIEEFEFDYPVERKAVNYSGINDNKNRSLNFSMPSMPNNYFWKTDNQIIQGAKFQYRVGENGTTYTTFNLVTRPGINIPFQQTQRIPEDVYPEGNEDIIIYVRVIDDNESTPSDDIAKFIFHPRQGLGFEVDDNIKDNDERYPRRDTTKYKLIGNVSFDLGDPITSLTDEKDNIADVSFGGFSENQTTYGFWDKNVYPLLRTQWNGGTPYYFSSSNQNLYGLFRSANIENVSKNYQYVDIKNGIFEWKYRYIWVSAASSENDKIDIPLRDRTYEISQDIKEPENIGKSKDDLEKNPKYGHFYYIDASSESGTLVKVPINGDICSNTEITVTAWLADMTRASLIDNSSAHQGQYPLAPNINVLFKGMMQNGEEKVLHRFTSGDALVDYSETTNNANYYEKDGKTKVKRNSNLMKWQQLYYTFVVDNNVQYDKYYLEIQNNEPHTDGADYAIDDIRIFKTKPQVRLVQAGDLCETEINTVRFVTDYNRTLHVLGLERGELVPENQRIQFDELPELLKTYLTTKYSDQSERDNALQYFTSVYYAVYKEDDKSIPIKINYNNSRADKQNYRISYVSTKLEDMAWTGTFTYNEDDPNPFIASAPVYLDGELEPNTNYIARLSTNELSDDSDLSVENNPCALVGDPFTLLVAGDIYEIRQGETDVVKPEDAIVNETYTITGKFQYKKDIAGDFTTLENATFDWFFGTLEEFTALNTIILDNGGSYSIKEALDLINTEETQESVKSQLKSVLDEKYGIKENDNDGRLILGASSFEYTMSQKYQQIVVQAQAQQRDEEGNVINRDLYCSNPVQISLGGTPPTIDPGDPEVSDPDPKDPDIPEDPDPKDPEDPQPNKDPEDGSPVRSVRLGLIQVQDMQDNQGTLRIPIHVRKSAEKERFVVDAENNIKVCETSDGSRRDLVGQAVATLAGFKDEYVKENDNPKWNKNYFKIQFNDLAVNPEKGFREGFWYMINIPYAVKDGNGNGNVVYRDSMKLTLKIVPEYVTWVGSETGMHNWNNDGPSHWRRSTNTELYMGNDNEMTGAQANGNHLEAYTPMRFTKVTIYGKAKYENGNYSIGEDAYAAYPHLYELLKPTGEYILDMAPANMDNTIGAATKNIEYDLLADSDYEVNLYEVPTNNDDKLGEHDYACVRFYGNTCDEIYIKPESEILHTEYLTYNKAHVDYEMDPNRWYMLASPLKGVVSGDMYLPTGNNGIGKYARQETPAFEDIKYNTTDYTRWEPAVYMRGWNSTSVKVIYPNDVANYGELINWSNLYNDVDVPFVSGSGFSIGTKTPLKPEKESVLFRLPKADVSYSYYKDDNETSKDEKYITSENRQGNGRFYFSPDTTSLNVTTTGMLGNPFMSHLDMKKFFDANHSTNNTYYIMSGNTTITNIAGDEYKLSTESDDPNYVAPLQSFIKNDLKKAVFTTAMIAKAPTSGKKVGLRSATAAVSEKTLPQLRITASRGGVHNTALVAGLVTASDSYIEGEDAALLINEEVAAPQVYTLAGNQMTAINVTPELKDIPVGIYGKDASPVELSFKLSGDMQNVTLVDKQSGKVYPVTDGLTLTVSGNTSGRYFLNGSIATSNEVIARNEIVCYANGNGQIVVSSVDPLTRISVYNVAGQRLRYLDNLNMQTVYVKDLVPGIYIVKAESVTQVYSEKMEVK